MRKFISWLLTVAMCLSLVVTAAPIAHAAEVTQRYIYGAEALPGGAIGVLFIYGGTSSNGIVTGGTLYYGVYDPANDSWTQQPITPDGASVAAKDAALALDGAGNPHVIYVTSDDNLGYTYLNGSSWAEAEIIDSIAFGGADGALSSPDIAVDSGGGVHLSYMDAKGGYTGSNDYNAYEKDDLVYAHNTSGSFEKTVRSYSHGWFYSPDGWRNLVHAPTKIALTNDEYCIGAKQYQYDKGMSTQYHTYGYDLIFDSTSLNYPIRSATTNNDLGFKLFEMDSDGSTIYSLFNKSSTLYVTGGVTEIPAATKAFSAATADMTVSGSDVYYAAMNATALLFYQNGSFVEGLNATTALLSNHTRMATVVTGGVQYILYTGNDADKSLFIAGVPISGSELTEYRVPNKTPVTISGVTVADKEYDGAPASPGGTLTVTGDALTAEDLDYTYTSTDAGGYNDTAPPSGAGAYKLVISVPESNANYSGASADIPFAITKKPLTVTGTTAVNRVYAPGNSTVSLNTDASVLAGVVMEDEPSVTLEKGGVTGAMTDAKAGEGKSVTVTGFVLAGSKAANYSLSQPTGVTVDIAALQLSAPTVSLSADSAGGLSFTVSDSENTGGVASYSVEVYEEGALKKTLTGINKDSAQNIPLETGVIEPESTYTVKARAVADVSGNYTGSDLGVESSAATAAYAPLGFADSAAYDIPDSKVDQTIAAIDVSDGVTGGKAPYVYSATELPAWAGIDAGTGIISGTPTAVAAVGGTATVTVTDAQSIQQSITIAYGAVGKGDALEFAGTAPPAAKTYGDAPFDIAGLTYDGEDGTVSYSYVSGPGSLSDTTLTVTGAGSIVVRATGTAANYETKTQDYTITVARKSVAVTPTAASNTKTYGDSDPALAYTHTELAGGDSLSGAILTRSAGEDAGSYPISIAPGAAASNPNYELALASGSHLFTITQKPLTISGATVSSKPYDKTADIDLSSVTSVTFSGLANSETLALGTDFEVTAASYTGDAFAGTNKAASITVALKNTAKANNYEFAAGAATYASATANITAAAQTISAANQTLTVSHTLDLSTIASSNAEGAALTYAIQGGASDYATLSGAVLTGVAPGTLTININSAAVNVNGAGDIEYSAAAQKQITVTVSAKINADDAITFVEGSLTYGQTYTPSPTTTLTGGAWSYQYSGTATSGASYSGVTPPTLAGSYTVTATYENDTHIGTKAVSLTIACKTITISGVTATNRDYDATNIVSVGGGTLAGVESGDTVTPVVPATGSTVNANAGSNKAVTLVPITLDGADKDNYMLTQPAGITVNIAPKVMTFTVDAVAGQAYTGLQIVPVPTVRDGATALIQDTDYTLGYGANLNAGTGAGSITVSGIGNYLGSSAEAAFDITKAIYGGPAIQGTKQVISNTASENVTYDLSALVFPAGFANKSFVSVTVANDSEGLLSGASVSGNTLTFDVAAKSAGISGELHVVVGSDNYSNYTAVVTVTAVDKTPVTVSGVTVADKTYNAAPIVPGGTPANDGAYSGTYEYWYDGIGGTIYGSTTAPANAGDYRLTVRIPAADPTYVGEQTVNFTISKAALTVKPRSLTIYAGDALPALIISYEGLQGNDEGTTVVQLSGGNLDMEIKDSDGVTALTSSAAGGSYAVVFTGSPVFQEAENYTITAAGGTLTISSRPSGGDGGDAPAAPSYTADVSDGSNLRVNVDTGAGNASVSLETGSGQLASGGTVVTMPRVPNVNTYSVGIPVPDLSTTGAQGALTLNTSAGSITVPSNMLMDVVGADGDKAQITIGAGDKERLPDEVKAAIGDKPLVSLTLSIDGEQTDWNNPNAPVTVSIPYTPTAAELLNPESIVVWYIDGSGNVVTIPNGRYDAATGTVTFQTTHFSDYAVAYNKVSFNDVNASAWYYDAVSFIAAREITTGTCGGNYSPEAKLTRGQFIVMLMRAYGIEPDSNGTDNFSDAGNTYYTGYLAAAKRLGISSGVGDNKFAPEQAVTRQEMFTLLYNALKVLNKLPGGDSDKALSDFSDSGEIASWAQVAMSALVKSGAISGNGGKLTPADTTTRAQMAQVLYSLLGK